MKKKFKGLIALCSENTSNEIGDYATGLKILECKKSMRKCSVNSTGIFYFPISKGYVEVNLRDKEDFKKLYKKDKKIAIEVIEYINNLLKIIEDSNVK